MLWDPFLGSWEEVVEQRRMDTFMKKTLPALLKREVYMVLRKPALALAKTTLERPQSLAITEDDVGVSFVNNGEGKEFFKNGHDTDDI